MDLVVEVYAAAANAGLLKVCEWRPSTGGALHAHPVGIRAPDTTVLDHLTLSTDTTISYPATLFVGLVAGESVVIDGVTFRVREVKAVGDGSEKRATLMRESPR